MHTLANEQMVLESHVALVHGSWDYLMPVPDDASGRVSEQSALRQAEAVIRVQEERIRHLEALALTDELTGLFNRRGFQTAFDRELSLARRDTASSGVLVMIDLDGFKQINDRFGHQAGDAYLRAVAQALQDCIRGTDVVGRLGGDEFALLLTHMDEKGGAKRLARLEQVFNARFMVWNGKRLPLKASFGAASYNGSGSSETIMHAADVRLYAHKARNKNLIAAVR